MKTGILWDLDGTLLDTVGDLTDAVNYALAQFGYPPRTEAEVKSFLGNGARRLVELSVPAEADVDAVLTVYKQYYDAHCQIKTAPYAGILEALAVLGKKYPMAVVSNKPDSAVKPLCKQHFPALYARGESADCPRKPAPDMLLKAMEEIGVDRCVYVGDTEVDVITAKAAGAPCLCVLWGFRSREEIEAMGGQYFCDDPADLVEKLEELINGK